jgi:hypothetical protein
MEVVMSTSRCTRRILALAVVAISCLAGCENPFWPCPDSDSVASATGGDNGDGDEANPPDQEPNSPGEGPNTPDEQDRLPPSVVATVPTEGQQGVEPDSIVSVTFDEPMNPESINAQTFFVDSEIGPVEGAVSYDEARQTATFTPSGGLILSGTYTAHLSAEVADDEGNRLGADKSWNFTVRDGTWGTPVVISQSGESQEIIPVAENNPAGDVIVIWRDYDDGRVSIWSNRYVPGSGWEMPVCVQANELHDGESKQLVVDSTGNATAVWVRRGSPWSSIPQYLVASRYTVGTGWSAPVAVEDHPDKSVDEVRSVVVVDDGDVFLFWRECRRDGTPFPVWAVHYDPSAGWNPPEQLSDANRSADHAVSRQNSGKILTAWREVTSRQQRIVARHYDPQVGWQAPEIVTQVEDEQIGSIHLVQNRSGDTMAGWWQSGRQWFSCYTPSTGWTAAELIVPESDVGGGSLAMDSVGNVTSLLVGDGNLSAARYAPGAGWSEPHVIYSSWAHVPGLRIDPFGNVFAVWQSRIYNNLDRVWAARYDIEEGWQATEELGIIGSPCQYSLDPFGNAVLAWTADELWLEGDEVTPIEPPDAPTVGVWCRRYVVGTGWTEAVRLDSHESVSFYIHVLIDDRGRVTLVWAQDSRIWACRYE